MDEPAGARPTPALLRESFGVVVANLGAFVPVAAFAIAVTLGIFFGTDYLLQAIGLPSDETKFTDAQFLLSDGVGNLCQILFMYPAWAAVYGVAFAVLRKKPPAVGWSAMWRRYLPVVALGLLLGVPWVAIDLCLRKAHVADEFFPSLLLYTVVSLPLMMSFPAMVGLKMGIVDSLLYSMRRFEEDPWVYFRYYSGALSAGILGIFACGVGAFVTLPCYAVAMAALVAGGNLPGVERVEEGG